MEQQIKMAAKLYECRDGAKSLAKLKEVDYTEMLKPYTQIIQNAMVRNNESEIQSLLRISKTHSYNDSGMSQMLFMAAVVEIIEPSNPSLTTT